MGMGGIFIGWGAGGGWWLGVLLAALLVALAVDALWGEPPVRWQRQAAQVLGR